VKDTKPKNEEKQVASKDEEIGVIPWPITFLKHPVDNASRVRFYYKFLSKQIIS
jgi:hypothetical protein